ncbi:unnamed protein product [Durusdinium trenchii]|uniref:B box-type domain-containing protein n=1 Tax=Durusdinium trenchii TaxID=1381693 RepID=A0ABP0LQE6_9DINO
MRVFLRTRGIPDNMKQCQITPKMVKDMAAQLGIRANPDLYWYSLFALRYSLAPEWEVIVKQDTRFYVHLPSDRMQIVHPMIRRFREHLEDTRQNEFLWEYRGFVQMKCSECGIPDAIVWCQQCTDYFCATCFLSSHKSARGKKHWPSPIPGCRYLTASEAARMHDHLPLLNVGFSMRRRFLARDNQSDRNGSRSGDTWLFFHADTFEAALLQAPEKHWFLKRLKPPRLAPTAEGYYYNFRNDVIADDPSHIMSKAHEQKAIALLQKNIRGAITRKRIQKELKAAKVIQKSKRMWDVRKVKTETARNLQLLKGWYMRYQSVEKHEKLLHRVTRFQAQWRGYVVRCEHYKTMLDITRFQAKRRHNVIVTAGVLEPESNLPNIVLQRRLDWLKATKDDSAHLPGSPLWTPADERNETGGDEDPRRAAKRCYLFFCLPSFAARLDVKVILYDKMETVRLLTAFYMAAGEIRHYIHPPLSCTEVTGKLANEEIGKRGLRVSGAEHLVYHSEKPDLVSHMLLSVTRHLLNQIPAEHFPVKHHHDWLITLSEESLPCLVLNGLPASHRHVSLTAEVLITMRQALESPTVSTEDHLRFQGLDAQAGAQMMEVLSSELDHRLPPDWHGDQSQMAKLV